jgi:hypothetical protein
LFVVPNTDGLPVGLAIFDGETVLLGPANLDQIPAGGNAGTTVSTDDALVTLAIDLCARYRRQAQTPT